MTREQSIETLKEMAFTAYGHRSEALDMAISALSDYDKMQKISLDLAFENDELLNELDSIKNGTSLSADGDCISRQAVLDELEKWDWQELYLPIHFKENIIDVLPSVQPKKGEWIPVSENPKEYDRYLTYHKDGKMHVGTWGLFGWNYGHYVEDVIAWMPLPEPYKKGGE